MKPIGSGRRSFGIVWGWGRNQCWFVHSWNLQTDNSPEMNFAFRCVYLFPEFENVCLYQLFINYIISEVLHIQLITNVIYYESLK